MIVSTPYQVLPRAQSQLLEQSLLSTSWTISMTQPAPPRIPFKNLQIPAQTVDFLSSIGISKADTKISPPWFNFLRNIAGRLNQVQDTVNTPNPLSFFVDNGALAILGVPKTITAETSGIILAVDLNCLTTPSSGGLFAIVRKNEIDDYLANVTSHLDYETNFGDGIGELAWTAEYVSISVSESKNSRASGYWYNTESKVACSSNPIPESTAPFTIDTWIYPLSAQPFPYYTSHTVCGQSGNSTEEQGLIITSNGAIGLYLDLTHYYATANGIVDFDQWGHIALTYDGTTHRVFWNGERVINWAAGLGRGWKINSDPFTWGFMHNPSLIVPHRTLYGYLDRSRITLGVARWTSSFSLNEVDRRIATVAIPPGATSASIALSEAVDIGDVLTVDISNNAATGITGAIIF